MILALVEDPQDELSQQALSFAAALEDTVEAVSISGAHAPAACRDGSCR